MRPQAGELDPTEIELFEHATRDVSANDAVAGERSRAVAPQVFVPLLGGNGPPKLGDNDVDDSEVRPEARSGKMKV